MCLTYVTCPCLAGLGYFVVGGYLTYGPSDQAPALYRDRLEIACDGLAPLSLDPASEGHRDAWIAGQAVHRGILADDEGGAPTAFWNIRFGLSDGPLPANCVLRTTATATAEAFVDGTAPADYPLVAIETQLTDALGAMNCADPDATSHARGVTRGHARQPHTFEAGFVPEGERAE